MLKWGPNIQLVRELMSTEVRFLIVGGYAVAWYECREPHKINDLDLLLEPTGSNAQKFVDAVRRIEPSFCLAAHQLARPNLHLGIKDQTFFLDVLTPQKEIDFDDLFGRSETASFQEGITARVISREDLIAMKHRTIKMLSEETQKHEVDLQCLEAI